MMEMFPNLALLAWSPPGWGAALMAGLVNTLFIATGAFWLGLMIGLCGAMGKLYGGPVLRDWLFVYTTLVRALPELILILLLYYGLTDMLNRTLVMLGYDRITISGVAAGIIALGIVNGAYATEVLRGAMQAVPKGQVEAARAMGMPFLMIVRRIIAPNMLALALPGMSNLWLIATKDTALLAAVGFTELTLQTRQAAGTTKAFFTFFMAAGAIYMAISLFSVWVFARMERWARRGEPPKGQNI